MNIRQKAAAAALSALSLSALVGFGVGESAQPWHQTLYVFGTLVEVEIRGATPSKAQGAGAAVARVLNAWHRDWHAWKPGQLDALNHAIAAGGAASVDATLLAVLDDGARLSCLSDGLFEPAIGNLINLWGFHQDEPPQGALPDAEQIETLRAAAPHMTALSLRGDQIASDNAAVSLDLGGFAKGAALDLAAGMLTERGIRNAVLNAGGDVNVIGDHQDRPWRVAIRDPFVWGAVAAIDMAGGEVLYTSGNYERFFDLDGVRFAHIIDPRSGWPVLDVVSVSVLARDGGLADAAATAISVAGDDWPRIAGRMGTDAVLVIRGDGRMQATPQMLERLDWTDADAAKVVERVAPVAPSVAPDCGGVTRAL